MIVLVTGGAGFIGSEVIRHLILELGAKVINIDKITYAGNVESLNKIVDNPLYVFEKIDICDRPQIDRVFEKHQPDYVMHLAAESHVDRSIDEPSEFIYTNVIGTYTMLEASRRYLSTLTKAKRSHFRFHHISTDEVYGDLCDTESLFTEETSYAPSSPYSASKASSDHLVRAWHRTFEMPILVTNCSNNYGPYQFPEKLIPLMIINAIRGKPLTVYGSGNQVRDWLHVEDHVRALIDVLLHGKPGETYNIGGHNEKSNIDVVKTICAILEDLHPLKPPGVELYEDLIINVKDRPGHDLRYAIDAKKIETELGWLPQESFDSGIRKTISWYLDNRVWWENVLDGSYSSASSKTIIEELL